LCPWILSHRTRMHPWIGDQEDFILDTHIPQIGEILKGGAASPDVLASGRPPYPAPPNTIPSDKPPQLLRTSEPGTRRKPPARTSAGRGWCRAPFRAERGIRKRNRRLCRRRACDWHELAAIWRMRANATNCNVINQPFASRSAWRSPPPPAGADERLARRPGCIQANTPAIPKPGDCGSFIVRGKEPRKREGATRRPHRRIGGDLPPVRRHAWAGTGAVPGPGLRHLDRLAMAMPDNRANVRPVCSHALALQGTRISPAPAVPCPRQSQLKINEIRCFVDHDVL
jgi:hypothetical protein